MASREKTTPIATHPWPDERDKFLRYLENERAAYERAVTDWERDRYFEQI